MPKKYKLRAGEAADEQWIFGLFRRTMQHYIDEAWGWDEIIQREGFLTSLPMNQFTFIEAKGHQVGGFHISKKSDHLVVDMILVEPDHQRQGWGLLMAIEIKQIAVAKQKPVRLSVLKTNPAIDFHFKIGFEEIEEDEHSIKMLLSV